MESIRPSEGSTALFFLIALAFRMGNALLMATSFDPDEYWQSLEVAHQLTFGYGYLTWEWAEQLRGFLHPSIFAVWYTCLAALGMDTPWMVVRSSYYARNRHPVYFLGITPLIAHSPRLLQGFFAAIGDVYIYKVASKWYQPLVGVWAYLLTLSNWFMFYTMTRTYSNSLETVLTVCTLYYWPDPQRPANTDKRKLALALAAVTFVLRPRPTSAIYWLFLGLQLLYYQPTMKERLHVVFFEVVPIGMAVLMLSVALDSYLYGNPTFVAWNFLKFNVLGGSSVQYGSNPWHWYLSNGLPTLLGSYLPLVGFAVWNRDTRILPVAWVIFVFSMIQHKEFRFILPVLPHMIIVCASAVVQWGKDAWPTENESRRWKKWFLYILVIIQVIMALYFSTVHQRGSLDAIAYVQTHQEVESVAFLMPCHSTPFYSHVHRNIPMKIISCLPELPGIPFYDEQEDFYRDPMSFLENYYSGSQGGHDLPTHVILFHQLQPRIEGFLEKHKYTKEDTMFHTHFPERWRSEYIYVYRKND